ncbi:cation transporter [Desertimonas flava]|uniref:cation transporter n=1 Tax=Desertimonas flava TaxID=2064846 RepID=UPI0013C495A7|nr:cation transporter [Desertimonas flava]
MIEAAPRAQRERSALRVSIVVTAALSILGIVWGITAGSQMILLDGAYGFIGIVLSWLLIRASSLAEQGPTTDFHYGRHAATPLVIGIQGLVLAATLAYAAVEGVYTLRAGGSDITPGWAILYGAIATAASLVTWRWLRRRAEHSDLLTAEAAAWGLGAMRGVGMVVGFTIMLLLLDSRWDGAAAYLDPAMVLITCVAFVRIPVRMVRDAVVELLEGSPSADVQARVHAAIDEVRRLFDIDQHEVRMTKVGPKLYVEVDARVRPDVTVFQEHEVRTAVRERLDQLPYEVWLNVELLPHP